MRLKMRKWNVLLLVMSMILIQGAVWALSTGKESKIKEINANTFVDVSKKVLPSVVSIEVKKTVGGARISRQFSPKDEEELKKFLEKRNNQGPSDEFMPFFFPFGQEGEIEIPASGSGVIIRSDGYIVTNYHMIVNSKDGNITVKLNDDTSFEGDKVKVIGEDEFTDLAVIKIQTDRDLPALEFADSDALEIGEWVLAMGNPLELKGSVSDGIISAKHRVIGKAVIEDLLQTSAAINPGNSGGPLVNLENKIVGINTAIASNTGRWQGVGFAIPSNTVKNVCDSLIESGKTKRGWLGIWMGNLTQDVRNYFDLKDTQGIIVTKVIENSPADKAGIKAYDIVTKVDGEQLKNSLEMLQKIAPKAVGKEVLVTLLRQEGKKLEEKEIKVPLGERPAKEELEPAEKKTPAREPMAYEELGIRFKDKGPESKKEGLEIEEIKQGSPADKARLRTGDMVMELNREKISSLDDFRSALKKVENDRDHFIMYQRNNEIFFATIKQK